jgi:hypothetical protein
MHRDAHIQSPGPDSASEPASEPPFVVRAAQVAGALFMISALYRAIIIGVRLVKTMGSTAGLPLGYFAVPACGVVVCGMLGASLRRGSLRYRTLAAAITVFFAGVLVLLKIRAVVSGKVVPTTDFVVEDLLFSAAVLPVLARHPRRIHLRVGHVVGGVWGAFVILQLLVMLRVIR